MNNYWLGDQITIFETFTVFDEDADPQDVPTNPDTVTFTIIRPDGTEDTFTDTDPQVANPDPGVFELAYDPPTIGHYDYRVVGTGAAQAAIENEFHVYSRFNSTSIYPIYVTPIELAGALRIDPEGDVFDDLDRAVNAASRAIDDECDQVFGLLDDSNDEVRLFTAMSRATCYFDSAGVVTEVAIDRFAADDWTVLTEGTDYVLERVSVNSVRQGDRPYNRVKIRARSVRVLPPDNQCVRITGRFGWATTPPQIIEATGLLAQQFFKRRQEAPFGVVSYASDNSVATRLLQNDPQLCGMIEPFKPTEL